MQIPIPSVNVTNYKRDAEDKRNKFVAWQRIHDKKPTESSAKELALAKADYDQAKKQRKDAQARQAARSSQTLAKFPTETSSASAAARPCKREQNVGKARKEYLDKDLLATEARTKVLHLQLAATTLERRIDARPQEITRLQTEAQHADRHAIVLEREAQAAKAKLTKAEEYLLVGQARAKALKDKSATTIPSSTVPAVSEHGSTGIDHTEVSQGERIKTEVEDLTDLVDEFKYAPSDDDAHKISPQEAVHEKASETKAFEHQSLPTLNALENDLAIKEESA
ncbi:MAG: hypothetical protein LQ350_002786 [Teloschistes chrysophthalmus]|nr:MAG: hypothetical protein LQ350_002786 [Niorma chrysophthalma]